VLHTERVGGWLKRNIMPNRKEYNCVISAKHCNKEYKKTFQSAGEARHWVINNLDLSLEWTISPYGDERCGNKTKQRKR
jgi:hypothetical protein